MDINEVEKLREQIEIAEKEKIRLETLLDSYLGELKEMGIQDIAEAEKVLTEKKEKIQILESRRIKLEKELEQLISEYNNGE